MNKDSVFIERAWSYPEWSAFFLEKCAIYIQIRNKSADTIQIERVECKFEIEDGVDPYTPSISPYLSLSPGYLSRPIRIEFEADLALRAGTNFYRIITYFRDASLSSFEYDPRKFLIFTPLASAEKSFFVSHKDPEDRIICRLLAHFLKKLGFIGYLSEDDHLPGMDLWREKIPAAIESSGGVIVLWTSSAAQNPECIYRELDIAKSKGKRLIVAREQGVADPDMVSKEIEYFQLESAISAVQLKNLACSIEDTHRRGGYS